MLLSEIGDAAAGTAAAFGTTAIPFWAETLFLHFTRRYTPPNTILLQSHNVHPLCEDISIPGTRLLGLRQQGLCHGLSCELRVELFLSTRVLRGVPAGELGERFLPVVSCWASTVDWIGSAASDTPNLRSSSCEMEITAKNDSRAAVVCAAFTVLGCHTVCRLSFCGPWTVGWPGPGPAGYE